MFSFDLFLFLQTGKHLNYLSIFHIKLSHLEMFKDYENGNEERQISYNILLLHSTDPPSINFPKYDYSVVVKHDTLYILDPTF